MQRRRKHATITTEELLPNGDFYVIRAEML
jgi:hypothetical protein